MSLTPAHLLQRYKRFLADVTLSDGTTCTVHCPNPGRMTGLAEEGMRIFLRKVTNPKAKLSYRWVMTETATGLVGVDTVRANEIMQAALTARCIPNFADYDNLEREVTVEVGSRLDFCLTHGAEKCFIEVKSVTLAQTQGIASFPDTPTLRGRKHLEVLMRLRALGYRAVLAFVVQREDCQAFTLAENIDPAYAKQCRTAMAAGVEVYIGDCTLDATLDSIVWRRHLAWHEKEENADG